MMYDDANASPAPSMLIRQAFYRANFQVSVATLHLFLTFFIHTLVIKGQAFGTHIALIAPDKAGHMRKLSFTIKRDMQALLSNQIGFRSRHSKSLGVIRRNTFKPYLFSAVYKGPKTCCGDALGEQSNPFKQIFGKVRNH